MIFSLGTIILLIWNLLDITYFGFIGTGNNNVSSLYIYCAVLALTIPLILLHSVRYLSYNIRDLSLTLFLAWMVFNSLYLSIDRGVSVNYSIAWLLVYASYLFARFLKGIDNRKLFLGILLSNTAYLIICFFYGFIDGRPVPINGIGLDGDSNRIAFIAATCVFISLWLFKNNPKPLYLFCFGLNFLFILLTASRSCLFITLFILVFLSPIVQLTTAKLQAKIALFSIFIFGLSSSILLFFYSTEFLRIYNRFSILITGFLQGRFQDTRANHFEFVFDLLDKTNAFVYGLGLEAYRSQFNYLMLRIIGKEQTLHSLFLSLGIGLGLIGLLLFIVYLILLSIDIFHLAPMSSSFSLLIVLFIFNILFSLVQPMNIPKYLIFWLPLLTTFEQRNLPVYNINHES